MGRGRGHECSQGGKDVVIVGGEEVGLFRL